MIISSEICWFPSSIQLLIFEIFHASFNRLEIPFHILCHYQLTNTNKTLAKFKTQDIMAEMADTRCQCENSGCVANIFDSCDHCNKAFCCYCINHHDCPNGPSISSSSAVATTGMTDIHPQGIFKFSFLYI
jgi:hypothetical protein